MSVEKLCRKLILKHVLIDNNSGLWNGIFLVLPYPKFGAIKAQMYTNKHAVGNNKLYSFWERGQENQV